MQSASFRVLSTVVWVLLLVSLALVIALVVRDNPSGTQSTLNPSSQQTSAADRQNQATEEPVTIRPTFTSTPYVIQPASVPLLGTKRILAGGYSFRPIEGYEVKGTDGSVTMTAPNADADIGPSMLLIGGAESTLIQADTATTEDAFDQFVNSFAKDGNFAIGDKVTVSTQNLTGVTANLSNLPGNANSAKPFSGRIFLTRPNPPQYFVLVAIAPTDAWDNGVAQQFEAVLDSVNLFQLTAQFASASQPTAVVTVAIPTPVNKTTTESTTVPVITPDSSPADSGSLNASNPPVRQADESDTQTNPWLAYTNGNFVNEAIVVNNQIWAATDGGVVVWNQNSGSAIKFTTADGLLSNQTNAVAFCDFTDLGVVFGTSAGLQIFNLGNGRWSTLNSENSLMSFDSVSDLYCDSTNGFMVIGYERHGIDIFDANQDEWLHFDRNRALVSNIVRQLTVVGDREEIWIVSDLGLTILENIPEPDNRRSFFFSSENSPLRDLPIDAIAKAADDSLWLAQENTLYRVTEMTQSVAGSTQRDWSTFELDSIEGDSPRGPIYSITAASDQSSDQTVWVGTQGRDICRFDPETSTCSEFSDDSDRPAIEEMTSPLTYLFREAQEGGDDLFFATDGDGLSHFDGEEWTQLALSDELLASNSIRHLTQSTDGTIWVATSAGIQLLEKDATSSFIPIRLIEASAAQSIRQGNRSLFDSVQRGEPLTGLWANEDGITWLGTDSADRFDGTNWQTYTSLNGLVGSPVHSFAVDNQNRTWIGTENGLNVLNEDTFFSLTTDQGLPDDNIQAIVADPDIAENIVWIGTAEGGLLRFEKNQLSVFNVENADLPSDFVSALAFDADGSLLVGTDKGLARLNEGSATQIRALGDIVVTAIATGPSLTAGAPMMLWVGTEESGLFYYNGIAWDQLPSDRLPDIHIAALLVDSDGTVWIGGANGGLIQYKPIE